ncbi:MAG: hypothetical protein WA957_12375 [Alteraurantiacibacter sp.]
MLIQHVYRACCDQGDRQAFGILGVETGRAEIFGRVDFTPIGGGEVRAGHRIELVRGIRVLIGELPSRVILVPLAGRTVTAGAITSLLSSTSSI